MTEDEAKQKWCPFARLAHRNAPTGGNRIDDQQYANYIPNQTFCIASDCMAWRWDWPDTCRETGEPAYQSGYCGLAEKP